MTQAPRQRILLHVCCAPCSTAVIERLAEHSDVVLLWYNPNITAHEEYDRRLAEVRRYAGGVGVELVVGDHDPERWTEATSGLEAEPEGGRRCDICYEMRLRRAAEVAEQLGIKAVTTTLSISPHKKMPKIEAAAERALSGTQLSLWPEDFGKQGGFERSAELSREHALYRQGYCGCEPSKREAEARRSRRR